MGAERSDVRCGTCRLSKYGFHLQTFAFNKQTCHEPLLRVGQCTGNSLNALYAKPLMLALPYWLRLWQCITQLRCHGGNRWHALNALKYTACLAVVGSSAALRLAGAGSATNGTAASTLGSAVFLGLGEGAWWTCWITALCIKTCYCYWWDLVMDWGLLRVGVCGQSTARVDAHTGQSEVARGRDANADGFGGVGAMNSSSFGGGGLGGSASGANYPFLRPRLLYSPPMVGPKSKGRTHPTNCKPT